MSYFNVFSIGLFCPIKLAHLEMSDKSVVNVKTPAECLEYLKHITNKFISVGMEPPIGFVNHGLFALGPPSLPWAPGHCPGCPPPLSSGLLVR